MKRSEMLKLVANQLNFLNGTFDGLKDIFTEAELAKADVILTTMEEAGMQPPKPKSANTDNPIFLELENYIKLLYKWEPEDETK